MSYIFTSAFMHVESILTPCQKVCYYSKHNIPPYYLPYCASVGEYSFILQGWHIYIEGVGLFLVLHIQPLYHYFNRLPPRKWGLVQKDLESTLTRYFSYLVTSPPSQTFFICQRMIESSLNYRHCVTWHCVGCNTSHYWICHILFLFCKTLSNS